MAIMAIITQIILENNDNIIKVNAQAGNYFDQWGWEFIENYPSMLFPDMSLQGQFLCPI